jgi:hypothetical protein
MDLGAMKRSAMAGIAIFLFLGVTGRANAQSAVTTSGGNAGTVPIFTGSAAVGNSNIVMTSSGTVLANNLALNALLPVDVGDPVAHNYKIATLVTSNASDLDHLHILVTVNTGWFSNTNSYIDATFANRNGFQAQYTLRGASVGASAKLTAYSNSDGTVDIYVGLGPATFSVAGYTVLENVIDTVYANPVDVGPSPSGSLVFDSSSSSYRPATFVNFRGDMTIGADLTVPGSIHFSNGSVQTVAWNGTLCGGDYAESVDVSGDRLRYEPGDVLVIDPAQPGKFLKSDEAYSKRVTGVFSTKPGVLGRRQAGEKSDQEVPMAMIGIVPVKVSAENGPINPGDFLVSASRMGYAMKGTDRDRMFGATIGKALGSLESGTGVIEAAITLQ